MLYWHSLRFQCLQYAGVWYEAYRNINRFEFGYNCANATYTKNTDGSMSVLHQARSIFGTDASLSGTARVKNASEPAAFEVAFPPPGDYCIHSFDHFI